MGPIIQPETATLPPDLEVAPVLPEVPVADEFDEHDIPRAYKKGDYAKASDERRLVPTDSPDNLHRAWAQMVVARAASAAKPRDYEIFDLVVMGAMTIAEAAAVAKIPATTARDRYHKVLAVVAKTVRNDPEVRRLFADLCAEVGASIDNVLTALAGRA